MCNLNYVCLSVCLWGDKAMWIWRLLCRNLLVCLSQCLQNIGSLRGKGRSATLTNSNWVYIAGRQTIGFPRGLCAAFACGKACLWGAWSKHNLWGRVLPQEWTCSSVIFVSMEQSVSLCVCGCRCVSKKQKGFRSVSHWFGQQYQWMESLTFTKREQTHTCS